MRGHLFVLLGLVLGGSLVGPAFAHGGRFTGRPGVGPPGIGSGTAPPGGVGARTGSPGGAGAATGRPGGGGPATARGAGNAQELDQWTNWWEYNKEQLLLLRSHLATPARTGPDSAPAERISRRVVHDRILPALIAASRDFDPDVADAAAIAIGRSCGPADADVAYPALMDALSSTHQSVREAATLALGLLGDARAFEVLSDLALDTPKARRHLELANATPQQVRCFAAVALGYLGDARGVAVLKTLLEREQDAEREVKVATVIGLGLLNRDDSLIAYLLDKLDDRELDRVARAHIPTAIARFDPAGRAAVPTLLQVARRKDTDDDLLRSLVLALGRLGSVDQPPVIDFLRTVADRHSDAPARHFAWIALGQIGARDREAALHAELHHDLATMLLEGTTRVNATTTLPWAALGLALYAREQQSLGAAAIDSLQAAFARTENTTNKAAIAISLALVNAVASSPALVKEVEKSHDQLLRGYLALALGVMRQNTAAPILRRYLRDPALDWRFRFNLARGLGLMADAQAIPDLIDGIKNVKAMSDAASLSQALGLIGDQRAIEPLASVLADRTRTGVQRGFAAVALGLIGEKTELPWHSAISVGLNYHARTAALSELLDLL
jgi:HEAT repeat protein